MIHSPSKSPVARRLLRHVARLARSHPRSRRTDAPPRTATRSSPARHAGGLALLALLALAAPPATAQDGTIAGTVQVERALRPLSGAQITVEGQAGKEAVTDASGRFRITGLTGSTVTINVRALGFRPTTQSVTVGATNLRVLMAERAIELNQVVVTGTAGGEQLRSLGTSVAKVNVADVAAQTAVPSMDALLNGRTPGVVVLPGTGQVGSGANIRIRGIGTFSLSSQPLVYVDGIRVNNATGSGLSVQAFGSGVISRLNDFDPSEIESIEVLKGPAAATLYGTEAARGVINIITKKGAAGGTKYSFQAQGGNNWFANSEKRIPTNYCILLSATECTNSNATAGELLAFNAAQQEIDRGKPLFRNGDVRNYAGNVSGGTPLFRFFASGEMQNAEGAERSNSRRQTSVRTNLNITPNAKVDIATSMGYINSRTRLSCEGGCGGLMWESMYSNPANLPQFCGGDVGCTYVRGFQSTPPEAYDPLRQEQGLNRLTASVTMQYRPFSWMSHRVAIGTDLSYEDNPEDLKYITNDTVAYFWGASAQGYRYHNQHQATFRTYDYTGSLNFQPTASLSSKTSFGVQYYTKQEQFIQGEGDYFPAPGLSTISSAGQKVGLQDGWSGNNTLGYYAQEQVGWKDRLFLTGAARVDNNSSFGKDVSWVVYPKASLSYVASEDPWVRAHLPNAVNSLRLRAAYGASGQQPALNTALADVEPRRRPERAGNPHAELAGEPQPQAGARRGDRAGLRVGTVQRPRGRRLHLLPRPLARRDPRARRGAEQRIRLQQPVLQRGTDHQAGSRAGDQDPDHQPARLLVGRQLHDRDALLEDRPAQRARHHDRQRLVLAPHRLRPVRLVLLQGPERHVRPDDAQGDQRHVRQRPGTTDRLLQCERRYPGAQGLPGPLDPDGRRVVHQHVPLLPELQPVRDGRLRDRLSSPGQQPPHSLPDLPHLQGVSGAGPGRSAQAGADAVQRYAA